MSLATDITSFFKSDITTTDFSSILANSKSVFIIAIDSALKHVLSNGVIVYDNSNTAVRIAKVVNVYSAVWNDQGITVDISEKQWMSITLKPDFEVLKSARVYSVGFKNRAIIDVIFDKMHKKDKMTWTTQFTFFNFSTFVVWRDISSGVKNRVVVDIREFNKIALSDFYSLLLQSDIINAIADYEYINTIDVVDWFYQFNVQRVNRHKFTIISHCDQEQFNVALMGFKSSSLYVQRQTDQMFRFYKQFFRAFIDDIVVFSHTLKKHIRHLSQIFGLFTKKRVNLTSIKLFLSYSSITLLNQRVDSLKLFIFDEKLTVIVSLQFSNFLKDFEYFLGLIEWFRHCVERYVQLIQSLTVKKTTLFKLVISIDNVRRRQFTQLKIFDFTVEKVDVFDKLQDAFADFTFLIHFDFNRRLYVNLNVFKRWEFVVMIYHVIDDSKKNVVFFSHECLVYSFSQQAVKWSKEKLLTYRARDSWNRLSSKANSIHDKVHKIVVGDYLHESLGSYIYIQTNDVSYEQHK